MFNDEDLILNNKNFYYVPLIPLVLVNGCDCNVSGIQSFLPKYNPVKVAKYLIKKLSGEEAKNLIPYYRGFTGTIELNA